MPIVVRCSDCGALLRFRDDALGKKARCTKCKGIVQVVPAGEPRKSDGDDGETFFNNLADAAVTASQSELYSVSRGPHTEPTETTGPDSFDNYAFNETRLGARPRVRIVVFVVMLLPLVFASQLSLLERLLACFIPLMLAGTFRTSTIRGDRFTTRFHVAFFPVVSHRCSLRGVTFIKVKFAWEGPGLATILMFGPLQWVLGWLFDLLIPSVGGPYQIRLVTAKGRDLVAWQGFVDSQFHNTRDLLVRLTNAEVRSM